MDEDRKPKILIVEDEAVFRLIYRGVLESHNYKVFEADTGMAGLELAKTEHPDLILLDLILPDISGYEVLKKIKAHDLTCTIPVIVFSVMGTEENIEKAKELGADYYRVKGANSPSDILKEIERIIGS
jgi:DNA-binding response OmpR family regulator